MPFMVLKQDNFSSSVEGGFDVQLSVLNISPSLKR